MKLLLALLVLPFMSTLKSDIDFTIIPENSIAVIVNNSNELDVLNVDKAKYTSGSNLSKLSFKGTETSVKFKKGEPLKIYARGGSNGQPMTFSIVKLKVDEKKRFASYNSITGDRISTVPCYIKEIDSKNKIYSVTPNEELEVGVYAFIFKRVIDGNFAMTMGIRLLNNPSVIEITE